ncbi:MAG: hypothetical protein V2J65_24015 [Desulfobacteraceae bacterium]|nr:hypothetical protein [Desulfobacteraceae bacterium]
MKRIAAINLFVGKRGEMKIGLSLAILVISISMTSISAGAATFDLNSANIKDSYLVPSNGLSVLHIDYYAAQTSSTPFEYTHVIGVDTVDNVKCIRVIFVSLTNPEFDESWVAQDINGDLYILKYQDGNEAPVVLGADGAELIFPKNLEVGDILDEGEEVTNIGVTVPQLSTGLGPFENCLQTLENDGDVAFYAPGYGMIKKERNGVANQEAKYILNQQQKVVVVPLN